MNKTRKTKLYFLLMALVCLIALCLCACSGGSDGANGTNGINGNDGANGKSAYEIWLDEGHTGSQADFLDWLKGANGSDGQNGSNGDNGQNGSDGKSAYQIFMSQYPYYQGTEEQWIYSLVNGQLRIHKVTFKSEVAEDIIKYVISGYSLTNIPKIPEKEGQTSAAWSVTDFSSITEDTVVSAVYDMRKYVTFHNEFTDDEDIVKTVEYGDALTDIPQIPAKDNTDCYWSVTDFSEVKMDMRVNAVYETQGLYFALINQQTQYRISNGNISDQTEELFIPAEHDGKAVTVIDTKAFENCTFTIAHIPDSIVEIRENAFYGCANLTSVVIPDGITNIAPSLFQGCNSLTSVNIPDGVTSIGTCAFCDCSSLTSIEIPDSVTSLGESAFYGCSDLTGIEIPSSVTSMGGWVFANCSSLTIIEIPDGVTSIVRGMFRDCINLTSIVIADSVTTIADEAFYGCSKLEKIFYKGMQADYNKVKVASSGNAAYNDTVVYFYSVMMYDGNYWHYDTDGKTPIVWA